MIRRDLFYCDKYMARYSLTKIDEDYELFSVVMAKKYPGYVLDQRFMFVNQSDVSVEIDALVSLLKSKDVATYEKVKDHFFGSQARFLKLDGKKHPSVAYTTYPRSGNSLMRKYFESLTGIATGSDMVMKHSPNIAL